MQEHIIVSLQHLHSALTRRFESQRATEDENID